MMYKENIAAIATPFGTGGISVIRISGQTAIFEFNKIFKGKNLVLASPRRAYYGHIVGLDGQILDEVVVTLYHGPKSFSGENLVEVSTHGGILVTQRVLEEILKLNVRLASPGEFSERAYLNGRIDLVEAEAIMDLISAKNESALKIATLGITKSTTKLVEKLRDEVIYILGLIEVNIDYPEYDDAEVVTREGIKPVLKALILKLEELVRHSKRNQLIKDGIKTVIIGRPNVGKSSLLNALIDEDKAIVTNIAGTTRDLVEASLNLGGITLNLIDTAGIRETVDEVESIGVERSKQAIDQAHLVLLVLDQSEKLTEEDKLLLELTQDKKRIIIGNKADLEKTIEIEKLLPISSITKAGLKDLEAEIIKTLRLTEIHDNDFNYLANIRQISKANEALFALEEALEAANNKMPIDLIEVHIQETYYRLGDILGKRYNDDIHKEIFSKFCLGK